MGKRKERRLAAKNASGRRVKLDLFAEPSGDLGGSSAKGEVGGDGNSKNHAGSPNSPSSSGQPPENPLSLLGQYSDDDLDDESSELINHTVVDTPPKDFDDQVNLAAVDKECEENTKINSSMDHDSLDIGEHNITNVTASTQFMQELQESSTTQKDATNSVILHTNSEPVEHVSTHLISDMQVNGDECSGWKMVLHEESNQYYYWNTLTGETSWNVPDILTQQTIFASEVKSHNDTDGADTAVVGIHELNSGPDICADENCKKEEMPKISQHMEVLNEEVPSEMPKDNSGVHDVKHVAVRHDHSSPEKLEAYQSVAGAGSGTDMQNTVVYGGNESGMDLCSRLLRLGEFLLERLDTLKGSKGRLIGHDKISKYTVEVEMRLSDIKSLATHGSSLLPFWLHCDKKFKQLESAISDEVLQFYESVELNAIEANENIVVHPISKEMDSTSVAVVGDPAERGMQESHSEADDSAAVKDDLFTSDAHVKPQYDSNSEGKCEAHEAAVPDELTVMPMVQLEEDVDMDVEMELEDVPSSHTTYSPSEQQPVWPKSAAEHEGAGIPPPPDDDWIPPPPPDDEPFPPPPPDNEPILPPPPEEVSRISYPIPLPDPMTLPSFSYTTQYNINYTGSSLEYYGQSNAEVQENNYYAADTNQINVPLPSLYYEAVPHAYPAPADVNPGEHGSYYGLQDEAAPPVPGVTCVQSSILHIAAGQGCEDSDQIRSEHITLPTDGSDVRECENKSVQVSLTSVSDQAVATNLVTQVSSMSSIPAVPEPLTAAVPKVQSKVPRNKKRATAVVSTLKSNKKVSSLVDKWKAAKEELHEEEDEPENAYEMLEKKRQREIEEWRAQQIASGEAKDNANFQPLGGDWRERVKRKRARLMKKSLEDLSDNVTNGNQRPDLDKLKRDLPSGWQAYWDDASKQVYYGNSVTSETTWIKPT